MKKKREKGAEKGEEKWKEEKKKKSVKKESKKEVKKPKIEKKKKAFSEIILEKFPWIEKRMKEAKMEEKPKDFVNRVLILSVIFSIIVTLAVTFMVIIKESSFFIPPIFFIIFLPISFLYFLQLPRAKAMRMAREIDKNLLFAGRHMWIDLKGGMPLFDSMVAVAKGGYGAVSEEFSKLVGKVMVGVPIDLAASEVVEDCPSKKLKRVLIQVINSIRSGADVGDSLNVILDQVSREQMIDIRAYGEKLNPIVMLYMVLGIIIPSIGVSVGVLLLSFFGIEMGAIHLFSLVPLIGLIQIIFLFYADISRPTYGV